MNKHIIFSDVDGTIYGEERTVQPATIKDISFAKSKDVEFVVSTGNGAVFASMERLYKAIDARYFITSNGASLYDFKENKYLIEKTLSASIADKIVQKATELKVLAMWWDKEAFYYNDFMWKEMEDTLIDICSKEIMYLSSEIDKDIFKLDLYPTVGNEKLIDTLKEYIESLGADLELAVMSNGHLEVTAKNVSKGETIKEFCKMFNIGPADAMGIGDSANDSTMFKVVGYSYAMDNAPQDVKEQTKYFTSDVHQNGLGEAIIDYLHRTKQDR